MQDSCMLGTTHSTEIQLPAKRERTGFCLSVMNNLESCDQCPKTFSSRQGLRQHLQTHKENVKKYMCPQCNKSFNIKSNLKTHILIHTGEKPHKCTMCDFAANRVHHLKMHMLKHTGENPHHCVQCEFMAFFGILWHFGIFAKKSNKKSNPIFPTFRLSDPTALI